MIPRAFKLTPQNYRMSTFDVIVKLMYYTGLKWNYINSCIHQPFNTTIGSIIIFPSTNSIHLWERDYLLIDKDIVTTDQFDHMIKSNIQLPDILCHEDKVRYLNKPLFRNPFRRIDTAYPPINYFITPAQNKQLASIYENFEKENNYADSKPWNAEYLSNLSKTLNRQRGII